MILMYAWFLTWYLCICSCYAQQFYDPTSCTSDTTNPGTRYTCNSSFRHSCQTFLVYRASAKFPAISNISTLFNIVPDDDLLALNNISSSSDLLVAGREVLIPITCSCSGLYFQSNFSYAVLLDSKNLSDISCGVFEGLVKSITLFNENPPQNSSFEGSQMLNVPLRCACPDNFSTSIGVKYIVTYPLILGDGINKVSKKFGVLPDDILEVNHLQLDSTIYPNTTILVPLKSKPAIDVNIPDSEPPTPGFFPTGPVEKTPMSSKIKKLYIAGSVVGFFLVLVTLIVCGLYIRALTKCKTEVLITSTRRTSFTSCSTPQISSPRSGPSPVAPRSSHSSCLSPDLLVGIKYSLFNFSTEDIRTATKDFSEDNMVSRTVYKGTLSDSTTQVLVKQMRFEDIRQIIDLHKNINHVNIMKLLGVCYGDQNDQSSWSYLVFEFPTNGCLRSCLCNPSNSLRWHYRTQIAFDIATGLHYLHYSMIPPYVHTVVSSTKIFVTPKWRAKLQVSGTAPPPAVGSHISSNDFDSIDLLKAFEKDDILAFGVVLLELISGKEGIEGKPLRESIGFLGGEASSSGGGGGCFEQLRIFVDPCLKEDYPLAEALCLAVLAKACVEDDPLHRPSMDDIIKVLARMV